MLRVPVLELCTNDASSMWSSSSLPHGRCLSMRQYITWSYNVKSPGPSPTLLTCMPVNTQLGDVTYHWNEKEGRGGPLFFNKIYLNILLTWQTLSSLCVQNLSCQAHKACEKFTSRHGGPCPTDGTKVLTQSQTGGDDGWQTLRNSCHSQSNGNLEVVDGALQKHKTHPPITWMINQRWS